MEGPDLAYGRDDGRHVAAVGDACLKLPERLERCERTLLGAGIGRGEMNERHTVVELECGIAKSRGFSSPQFVVDGADELLVPVCLIWLDSDVGTSGSFATSFAIVRAGQFALRARVPGLARAASAPFVLTMR
jgi:hypothetical protein